MNKNLINVIALFSLIIVVGCATQSQLQKPQILNTEYVSPTYYYCLSESCVKPSNLQKSEYKPLEPDEPIITALPVAEPIVIANKPIHQNTRKSKKRKPVPVRKKSVTKKKPKHIPQCVMWK